MPKTDTPNNQPPESRGTKRTSTQLASEAWSLSPDLPFSSTDTIQHGESSSYHQTKRVRVNESSPYSPSVFSATHNTISRFDHADFCDGNTAQSAAAHTESLALNIRGAISVAQNSHHSTSSRQSDINAQVNYPNVYQTGTGSSVTVSQVSESYTLTDNIEPDVVCYGLLNDFDTVRLDSDPGQVDMHWDGHGQLIVDGQSITFSQDSSDILFFLVELAGATFDIRLKDLQWSDRRHDERKRGLVESKTVKTISIIIYGLKHAADDIGFWLDAMNLRLQLPTHCSRRVSYCNPHATTFSTEAVVMTSDIGFVPLSERIQSDVDQATYSPDVFCTRAYPEAQQPSSIRSRLHAHQLQALAFLQSRELDWDSDNDRCTNDEWQRRLDSFIRKKYSLTLSQESQFKSSPQFKGGILADEIGLGKTCTMLSLIASDLPPNDIRVTSFQIPTLIVVPLPLLQIWERQIKEHFFPHIVTFYTYHGPAKSGVYFHSSDMVLTTYNVVAKEWKIFRRASQSQTIPPLYAARWHRIVLDEAHIIKNKDTDVARATSALDGDRRWCITGVPIQNRSSDIYSLLRFLKVYPYNDHKTFEATFVDPWVMHADESGLHKLRSLLSTIAIRRQRSTIELPHRSEAICSVAFSGEELLLYERAKHGALQSMDAAISEKSDQLCGASYLNALQKINDLRYICNHGIQPRPTTYLSASSQEEDEDTLVHHELDMMFADNSNTGQICERCGLDLFEDQEDGTELLKIDTGQKSYFRPLTCSNCGVKTDPLPTMFPRFPPSRSSSRAASPYVDFRTSSKIQALLGQIQQLMHDDRCVVFSYWTNTLKAIGQAFENANVPHLVYDGSLTRSQQDHVLKSFSNNQNTKALLVSIACGGQGLDLTAANHAFIFEPQWNPMLEEQAMARIHRLGQTKPVRLVRFIVKDTWEEKIAMLQKRKRLLADLIVDGKRVEKGEEARQQLLFLRDLVS